MDLSGSIVKSFNTGKEEYSVLYYQITNGEATTDFTTFMDKYDENKIYDNKLYLIIDVFERWYEDEEEYEENAPYVSCDFQIKGRPDGETIYEAINNAFDLSMKGVDLNKAIIKYFGKYIVEQL